MSNLKPREEKVLTGYVFSLQGSRKRWLHQALTGPNQTHSSSNTILKSFLKITFKEKSLGT